MTGPVLTHADLTAAGYEPERTEHQVVVVFDITAKSRFHAAQALADTLSRHGLLDSLRAVCDGRGAQLESWWFPEAGFKHIDRNDNAPMHLEHDEPPLDVYVEDDADDTPTVWLHRHDDPERPVPLLYDLQLGREGRERLWDHIVRGLPTAPPQAAQ